MNCREINSPALSDRRVPTLEMGVAEWRLARVGQGVERSDEPGNDLGSLIPALHVVGELVTGVIVGEYQTVSVAPHLGRCERAGYIGVDKSARMSRLVTVPLVRQALGVCLCAMRARELIGGANVLGDVSCSGAQGS